MDQEITKSANIKTNLGIKGYDYTNQRMVSIYINDYTKFTYFNYYGNCKTCSITNLQNCYNANHDKTFEKLDELFNSGLHKLVFNTTFTNKSVYKKFCKRYTLLNVVELPIGYGSNDVQYHCIFLTGITDYPGYSDYVKRLEKCNLIANEETL